MRTALWFLAIFMLAVLSALFAGNNGATVTLFWPPHRVDVSLNFAIVLLVTGFVLLYFALRALSVLFALPKQVKQWRSLQKERALNAHLFNAQSHFMAGRYLRARKAALAALDMDQAMGNTVGITDAKNSENRPKNAAQLRALAHVMVAQSAHALQDKTARDAHLELALEHHNPKVAQETREGTQMLAAQWALDDRDAAGALRWLNVLSQGASRRTAALRLRLKAAQLGNLNADALETARLLIKHRVFSGSVSQSLLRSLVTRMLSDARDVAQLQTVWHGLDGDERQRADIAIHAASCLLGLHGDAQQILSWLLPAWDKMVAAPATLANTASELTVANQVTLIQTIQATLTAMDGDWFVKIEQAQIDNPRDARLQYLVGMACKARSLWGKAQQLLQQAAPRLTAPENKALQQQAWVALAELAEQRGETEIAAQTWKKVAHLE